MNFTLLLVRMSRWLFRLLLLLLGLAAVLAGCMVAERTDGPVMGILLMAGGILLPLAEAGFALLCMAEKKAGK